MNKTVKNKPIQIIHKFEPKYIQLLIEHGNEGYPPDTFAGRYNIDPSAIDNWRASEPEFDTAYKICTAAQIHHWQKELKEGTNEGNKMRIDAAKTMLTQLAKTTALSKVKEYLYNFGGNKANKSMGDVDLAAELKKLLNE